MVSTIRLLLSPRKIPSKAIEPHVIIDRDFVATYSEYTDRINRTDSSRARLNREKENSHAVNSSLTIQSTVDGTDISEKPKRDKKEILCKYFKTQSCQHGIRATKNCEYNHPRLCRRFIKHDTRQPTGCNLGKKCEHFHPVISLDSLKNGFCYRQDCRFRHITGTKRQPPKKQEKAEQNQDDNLSGRHVNSATHNTPHENDVRQNYLPATNNLAHNTETEPNHFLELLRQFSAEITQQMDMRFHAIRQEMVQMQHTYHQANPQIMMRNNPMPFQQVPQQVQPPPQFH